MSDGTQPFPPNDPLGRVYTPPSLGVAVLRAVAARMAERDQRPPTHVLDPHAGRGDLLLAAGVVWPGCTRFGIDIDPGAEMHGASSASHVLCADWLTVSRFWKRLPFHDIAGGVDPDLVVDNPPFGKKVGIGVTIAHVVATLQFPHVLTILPGAYVCGAEFDRVWQRRRPSILFRIPARPWPDRLREACAMWWDLRDGPTQVLDIPWRGVERA